PPSGRRMTLTRSSGITGQDGTYLAELLVQKGYAVHGLIRRATRSSENEVFLERLFVKARKIGLKFELHQGDITDAASLARLFRKTKPSEIYNLAAQSHVTRSFQNPELTTTVNALGVVNLLAVIKASALTNVRLYQASSSEMFGNSDTASQNELTPLAPVSPYAVAKAAAHWSVINARNAYGLYAISGISFNHESPRRGRGFVSKRISRAVAAIYHGEDTKLTLADLDSTRDWGHARDYVEAMWRALQQPEPSDYVFATGNSYKIRDFVERAFYCTGKNIEWKFEGEMECGVDEIGKVLVQIDPVLSASRPLQLRSLCGDASKAQRLLGWSARCSFNVRSPQPLHPSVLMIIQDLVDEMVTADIQSFADQKKSRL
ncbi:GDP-mannose 4,6 dehydratase, partial [Lophium mytilinum]